MMIGYVAFLVLFIMAAAVAVIFWRNPSAGRQKPFMWSLVAVVAIVSVVLSISGLVDLRQERLVMK